MEKDVSVLLLSHELELAKLHLAMAHRQVLKTGAIVGEAMDQSSETWHDNAPADVALEEFSKARGRLANLQFIVREYVLLDYPAEDDMVIRIGSHVVLDIPEWCETIDALIIGEAKNLYPHDSFSEGMELISYKTPLARAVLNLSTGDTGTALINEKEVRTEVKSVDQRTIITIAKQILAYTLSDSGSQSD